MNHTHFDLVRSPEASHFEASGLLPVPSIVWALGAQREFGSEKPSGRFTDYVEVGKDGILRPSKGFGSARTHKVPVPAGTFKVIALTLATPQGVLKRYSVFSIEKSVVDALYWRAKLAFPSKTIDYRVEYDTIFMFSVTPDPVYEFVDLD